VFDKISKAALVAFISAAIITISAAVFIVYWDWLGTIHPFAQVYCGIFLFFFVAVFGCYLISKS